MSSDEVLLHHSNRLLFRAAKFALKRRQPFGSHRNEAILRSDRTHLSDKNTTLLGVRKSPKSVAALAQVAVVSANLSAKTSDNLSAKAGLGRGSAPCTLSEKLDYIQHHRRNRLSDRICFRLTRAEYERKRLEADNYGITLSDWARAAFLEHRLPLPFPSAEAIRAVLTEFSRASNTLNKIARRANSGVEVGAEVKALGKAMAPILNKFLKLEGLEP
jgi:hypothetical protein